MAENVPRLPTNRTPQGWSHPALFFVLAILAAQFCAAVLLFDIEPFIGREEGWLQPLIWRSPVVQALLLQLALVLFLLRNRWATYWGDLQAASANRRPWAWLGIQCLLFALTCWLAQQLFTQPFPFDGWQWPILFGWIAGMSASVGAAFLILAPAGYWAGLLRKERVVLLASTALMLAYLFVFSQWVEGALAWLWSPDSALREFTLQASGRILSALYPDLVVDLERAIIGREDFAVFIAPECSGVEGIALLAILVSAYLYAFRTYLRFPHAFILLVLAIPLSLSANILRIVVLVMVGLELSPYWAVRGFHTYGGVIVLAMECLFLLGLSQLNWFSKQRAAFKFELDYETSLLLPLLVLLASTLLTGFLTIDFNWLYPLRVLLVAATIGACWKALRHIWKVPSAFSLLVGAALTPLWIWLVPGDAEADASFANSLQTVAPGLALAWLGLRIVGTAVTVPIAEELAFRGYLLARLARARIAADVAIPFSWLALVGSSVLFGLLHGQWIAGTLAGLAYALVRYRSGRLVDAIAAHATTNALLSAYVLATGQWSYW